jgi:phage-related protein
MKDIEFLGRSLQAICEFPADPKREAGHQLDRVQNGREPNDWKPMTSIGQGVREIRIRNEGQYRVIYVAKYSDAIYVLHAFLKKTKKTNKKDIDAARRELQKLRARLK